MWLVTLLRQSLCIVHVCMYYHHGQSITNLSPAGLLGLAQAFKIYTNCTTDRVQAQYKHCRSRGPAGSLEYSTELFVFFRSISMPCVSYQVGDSEWTDTERFLPPDIDKVRYMMLLLNFLCARWRTETHEHHFHTVLVRAHCQ